MKYVLDSSVAVKWVIAEPLDDKARRLRDDSRNGVHKFLAPDAFPLEVGHALTRAERQGRISRANGWRSWRTVMTDTPRLEPSLALMDRAYEISSQWRVGLYDCLYVALAEREGCEFITADDRLIRNLGQQFPFIIALSSMP
jgi:predicted nucleic acid-binding protein